MSKLRGLTPEEQKKLAQAMASLNDKIDAVIAGEKANWATELFVLTKALAANGFAWGLSPEQVLEQTVYALQFHFENAEVTRLN